MTPSRPTVTQSSSWKISTGSPSTTRYATASGRIRISSCVFWTRTRRRKRRCVQPSGRQGRKPKLLPEVPALAVFDTAFHAGRPASSMHYALPRDVVEREGLLRYGFHGIAHAALVDALAWRQCEAEADVDAVTLQLGQGCSGCAVARP